MNSKTNKGITLIALVITIIVLLILAGVTISMVLGDDGIISQAQKAKEEQEKGNQADKDAINAASSKLDQYSEGTIANAAHKGTIKVGDYVKYEYLADDETSRTSIVEADDINNTGDDRDRTFQSNSISNWKVLSIKDGVIQLISVGPLKATDDGGLLLYGEKGYLNGSTVLNRVCDELYSGEYGTARNVNLEDVKKAISDIDGLEWKDGYQVGSGNSDLNYPSGSTRIVDIYPDIVNYITKPLPGGANIGDLHIKYDYKHYPFKIENASSIMSGREALELLYNNTEPIVDSGSDTGIRQVWLSDSAILLNTKKNQVRFCQHYIVGRYSMLINGENYDELGVYRTHLYNSAEGEQTDIKDEYNGDYWRDFYLCPVVTLKTGLMLDTTDSTKDGQTPDTAWVIKAQ